jgi:hypothetical protein
MKDTVHAAVHRSVHLFGEGKFYGALRLRFTRPLILGKGQTPEWAGATPLRCHGNRGGRSSPTSRIRDSFGACFAGVRSEIPEGADEEGKNYSLHFAFCHLLHPVMQVAARKKSGMSDITNGKVTLEKRLNRAGATPLFGSQSAQKYGGHSRPPRRVPATRFARVNLPTQEFVRQDV